MVGQLMPRFYFNLQLPNKELLDDEGMDLPDDAAARAHAECVARELSAGQEEKTRDWTLSVRDCKHHLQFSLPLKAAYSTH